MSDQPINDGGPAMPSKRNPRKRFRAVERRFQAYMKREVSKYNNYHDESYRAFSCFIEYMARSKHWTDDWECWLAAALDHYYHGEKDSLNETA